MIPALDLSTLLAGLEAPAPPGAEAKGDLFANLLGDAPVVATPDVLPAGTLATAPATLPKLKGGEKTAGEAESEPTAEGEGEEPELPPIIASLLAAEAPVVAQPFVVQPGAPVSPNSAISAETPVQSPTTAAVSIVLAPQVARQMPGARMIDEDVSLADASLPGESRGPDLTPPLDPGFRRGTDAPMPALARAISQQSGGPRADQTAPAMSSEPSPLRPAAAPIAPLRTADAFLATLLPQAVAATEALQPTEAAPQFDAVAPQLDLAHEYEWLDRLAKDIARTANPDGSLRFRLNPEHLGSLHVEVSRSEAGAAIRLTTETEGARQIIAEAQPRLIAEARAQGVKVSETHVDLGQSGQERGPGEQQRGDGQQSLAGDPRGNRERGERSSLTGNKPNGPKQDNEAAAAAPTSDRFA